jgi:hypothetical protein
VEIYKLGICGLIIKILAVAGRPGSCERNGRISSAMMYGMKKEMMYGRRKM